ncbi:hypothetical protein HZS_295 [Henneguya salminicola]|nr:hypothetical protein HZS_295 [Henneguya salminicola]
MQGKRTENEISRTDNIVGGWHIAFERFVGRNPLLMSKLTKNICEQPNKLLGLFKIKYINNELYLWNAETQFLS